MQNRKFLSLILICVLLLSIPTAALASAAPPPHMAQSVIIADLHTGDILYAEHEHAVLHPASLTKIMTVLLVIEALDRGDISISDRLVTEESDLWDIIPSGSSFELEVGEEMTLEALLYATMLSSANDASNVLARHVAGSIPDFVALMNERARELGATQTNFENPHGLTQTGHYSTAYDIFRITFAALQNPRFVEISNEVERFHSASNLRPAGVISTTNHMINPESPFFRADVSGVKTGFTSAAGFTFASTATRDEISLLSVIMGVQSVGEENHFSEAALLYDWAFASFAYQTVLTDTQPLATMPVLLGEEGDTVALYAAISIEALLPLGFDQSQLREERILFHEEAGEELTAPIQADEVLGTVSLYYGERLLGTSPLVAAEGISLSRVAHNLAEVDETLSSPWVRIAIAIFVVLLLFYVIFAISRTVKKRRRRRERLGRK